MYRVPQTLFRHFVTTWQPALRPQAEDPARPYLMVLKDEEGQVRARCYTPPGGDGEEAWYEVDVRVPLPADAI